MYVPLPEPELQGMGLEGVLSAPADIDEAIATLLAARPSAAMLDTYRGVLQWLNCLESSGVRSGMFDDHFQMDRPLSLIVNASPVVSATDYGTPMATHFLLGPAYASLSAGFAGLHRSHVVRPQVSRVLMALGGDDSLGNLPAYVRAASAAFSAPLTMHVVGARRVEFDVPSHIELDYGWVGQDQMAARMRDADLALIAGGSMIMQTSCIGVPTICWPQTEKQGQHSLGWLAKGAVVVAATLEQLPALLADTAPAPRRQQLSDSATGLVDGRGAARIAACLSMIAR